MNKAACLSILAHRTTTISGFCPITAEGVANLGTLKTANLEAVMACEPGIYLPTMDEATQAQTRLNAETIPSIFGKVAELLP